MEPSDRSSIASSDYAHHHSPLSGSATSSVYEPQLDSFQHPLGIRIPSPSSSQCQVPPSRQATPKPTRGHHSVDTLSFAIPHPASLSAPQRPLGVDGSPRPATIDSPRSAHLTQNTRWIGGEEEEPPDFEPRDLDQFPHGHTPTVPHQETASQDIDIPPSPRGPYHQSGRPLEAPVSALIPRARARHDRSTSYHTAYDSVSDYDEQQPGVATTNRSLSRSSTMSSQGKSTTSPLDLKIEVDGVNNTAAPNESNSPQEAGKRPKSPGISSFFGWRRGSNQNENQNTSPTTISDSRTMSPARSPLVNTENSGPGDVALPQAAIGDEDDYFAASSYYDSNSPLHGGPANLTHIDELMRELREVSAELAISIRREMELEDELDRCKTDMPTGPMEHSRRTSDYYSDSGASSLKLVAADSDTKIEALEKMRRKAEQEKAQLRLEMSQKAQDDLNERRALEMHVQSLEEQVKSVGSSERSLDQTKELEDTRRRLNEERGFKENFEDLLTGMREEIEAHRNERDNLRDEVVPQLRSRLEGLESQANDMQTLAYENTRLQQENQGLINENQTLVNARRLQLEMQQSNPRFRSIAEDEEDGGLPGSPGLGRSNSLARSRSTRNRSGSFSKTRDGASGEPHGDGVKAIEDQRDALQRTLKSLIIRQEHMTRHHAKHVRGLEMERDKAMDAAPRRAAFGFEVQHLRSEVNRLRQRADEALEQKWQCEKGLSGLMIDLDRAQQETSSLRGLLQENASSGSETPSSSSDGKSESLSAAYDNLRALHSASIVQLQTSQQTDNDQDTAGLVELSLSRMGDLSERVEAQLAADTEWRQRLSAAIGRGVEEQQASSKKIVDLEAALRAAEERLVNATNVSEEAVAKQEEYSKAMREATNEHSRRGIFRVPAAATKRTSTGSMASRLSVNPKNTLFGAKSPRLGHTSSKASGAVAETSQTDLLRRRVRDLEDATSRADKEMQQVIVSMNRAQIEVVDLQTERDEAMKRTRRLQGQVLEERERAKALVA